MARATVQLAVVSAVLVAPLDRARTIGLVTLPGAVVGVLLGDGGPVEGCAVWLLGEPVTRGRLLDVRR